jgi:hypothetical protein
MPKPYAVLLTVILCAPHYFMMINIVMASVIAHNLREIENRLLTIYKGEHIDVRYHNLLSHLSLLCVEYRLGAQGKTRLSSVTLDIGDKNSASPEMFSMAYTMTAIGAYFILIRYKKLLLRNLPLYFQCCWILEATSPKKPAPVFDQRIKVLNEQLASLQPVTA